MSEGEHTIIGKIPRERLNQIAARKLSALGIPHRLGADGESLEGELSFASRLVNPFGGTPIVTSRFALAGHDRLHFLDPPLAALPLVSFYDVEKTGALEARVGELLRSRAGLLNDLAARFRALRLEPSVDPQRLLVRAVVKAVLHAFELVGGPDGVRVSRVAPADGQPFEVPAAAGQVDLAEHASGTELELWLEGRLPELRPAKEAAERRVVGPATQVQLTPPPRNALTLEVVARAFGPEAVLAPNAAVEVLQEAEYAGTRYRFVATREVGQTFRGRLIGPAGDVWSDRFDLSAFPGPAAAIAAALGVPQEAARAPEPAAASAVAAVPQHLLPRRGEIWVMHVVVEQSTPEEVRYVGTDIDGRPYGAARVLKRSAFEAVFSQDRGGWRLLVAVDQVGDGNVVYRQLDPQRQPTGSPRKIPITVMMANFVPEATAY